MRPEAYSAILYALAEGVHPFTGDLLPDGLIDQPDVIRALYAGARLLETCGRAVKPEEVAARIPEAVVQERDTEKPESAPHDSAAKMPDDGKSGERPAPKPGRENAGKPWSKEDDALLMESYAAGTSVYHMAKAFKRSAFAIEARIEKLESVQPSAQKRATRIVRFMGATVAGSAVNAPGSMAALQTS